MNDEQIRADCRVTIAPRGMSFDATGRLQKGEHGTRTPSIQGAPLESYSPEDRAFYRFWYGHMLDDLMQPPLANVDHATARYIWDAAKEQR